jgi:mannose-6-phosphate isomerase-like protein (cupin superfamily)
MPEKEFLQILPFEKQGYAPLVFSQGWQTAILNYEPGAEVDAVYRVERHNLTDEVFVLWRGSGALVIAEPDALRVVDAVPGVIYNVTISTWHTVIGTHDSSWIIVENKDTHLGDTEYRDMTEDEMASFLSQLPGWAALKAAI